VQEEIDRRERAFPIPDLRIPHMLS
jgi:hypothetical protein